MFPICTSLLLSNELTNSKDETIKNFSTTDEKTRKVQKMTISEQDGGFPPQKIRRELQKSPDIQSNDLSFDRKFLSKIPDYKALPKGKIERKYTIANSPENQDFNRYEDVLPEDAYIYAPTSYMNKSEEIKLFPYYLNAVKIPIKVEEKQLSYIATQAPLEITFNEFWKAIVIGKSNTLVNLAMVIEKNKRKCDDYWSDDYWKEQEVFSLMNDKEFLGSISKKDEDIIVACSKFNSKERIVKRTFEFTPFNEKEKSQIITQYHYEEWPDFGIPGDLDLLETLINLIDAKQNENGPPIVHCSAGIGRTGTFIVIHALIEQIKAQKIKGLNLSVDPVKMIETLRCYKEGLVQSQDQLTIIYHALFKFAKKLNQDENTINDRV